MKNTNITIGNRTRHLRACSAVSQPNSIPPTLFPSVNPRRILYAFLASTLHANRPVSLIIFRVFYLEYYYALRTLHIKMARWLNRMPEK